VCCFPLCVRVVTASGFKYHTAGNNFISSYLTLRPKIRVEFIVPWYLILINLSSKSMHCQKFHKWFSVILSSSNTVCILSLQLLLFLARNYGIVNLLLSQLLVCKLIKFDASHQLPGCLSQLCCFGHVNGVLLTQVKWNVNVVLGLCRQGNLFCVSSSKTTLRGSRIATYTKTQHIYCTQFAEQILSFTRWLMTATVGFAGIRPRQ